MTVTTDASPAQAAVQFNLEPFDTERMARLYGQFDENLRYLEKTLDVRISYRGSVMKVWASEPDLAQQVATLLQRLYHETEAAPALGLETVHLFAQELGIDRAPDSSADLDTIIRTPRLQIKARSGRQSDYVRCIRQHDISFGIGPAGTGKTYLAVACAVEALQAEQVKRILLVRPAVEAGEKLGFLPGDLAQKVDPYLRPLYDALYDMLGFEQVARLMEKNVIEVAPLAFMRGRTLNSAFVILDESQNTTPEQMKMFLTRIGFGSTAVITGDVTQTDLPKGAQSGLVQAQEILGRVKGISTTHFTSRDVVRHPLVQRIVQAYDRAEARKK
jgi:phosphate starvation-inducible PhoH-like protein